MTKDRTNFTQREIFNEKYLQEDFVDTMNASFTFAIEEENFTYLNYKRTKVSYTPSSSEKRWSWCLPEVDTLNFLDFRTPEKLLFSSLKSKGYSSPLIDYFAECEENDLPLKDPEYNDLLIQRFLSTANDWGNDRKVYKYRLGGGNLIFHRILKKDPEFWQVIIKACRDSFLLRIDELHLAIDSNHDYMELVSECIKKGHYETRGLKVNGFYTLGGQKRQGALGKRSKVFPELKDKSFRAHTVYFGSTKYSSLSLAIYDKELEHRERFNSLGPCCTRFELRFCDRDSSLIKEDLLHSIVLSYFHRQGASFRTQVFFHYIQRVVTFTNHFHMEHGNDLAPWWKHQVLIPLKHASLEFAEEESALYLTGQSVLPISETLVSTKRKRGRPPGSKDKVKRKPKTFKKGSDFDVIDV